ncbi:MAG: prenyltransferase [Gammaproteobacteria bacterium]
MTISLEALTRTADYIAAVQHADGGIPWFEGGIIDPWDHVESAMGLSVGGRLAEAQNAFHWLARHQHPEGYWLAAYDGDRIADGTRAETNFVAYAATGIWHYYLVTQDDAFLSALWPTVSRALDFVLSLQAATGEVYWALDTRTGINKDALVTGCSSIYLSLDCGSAIAGELGEPAAHWIAARDKLGLALASRPERFDRTWESKARYSMDWFYPVLAGAISGSAAIARLDARWEEFVEPELGCRCVSDRPWITIAESCELVRACAAAGETDRAAALFDRLGRYQAEDGSWWTGYVFTDDVMWPNERPTWTAGAVLLAADALHCLTPAAGLFTTEVPHSQQSTAGAQGSDALQRPKRAYRG